MKILFVCRGNVGRSQMAEEIFNMLTYGKHETTSAGTKVRDKEGNDMNGQLLKDCKGAHNVLDALREFNIDILNKARVQLQPEMLNGVDKIVVMAEHENIPEYLKNDSRAIFWNVKDPKGTDLETHKQTMYQIKGMLEEWVKGFN
jgi:protein-tyrosine-phosphatase